MSSPGEILRSVAPIVAGFVAMLVASAVLGLYVQRSIGQPPSTLSVSISAHEEPALPWAGWARP